MFGGALGFSNESINIGSKYGTVVIQHKKWIAPQFFEIILPLPH